MFYEEMRENIYSVHIYLQIRDMARGAAGGGRGGWEGDGSREKRDRNCGFRWFARWVHRDIRGHPEVTWTFRVEAVSHLELETPRRLV